MSIKVKYNLFSFFYYLMTVCLGGFIAIFLQYKGVSNTQIGIITGTACIAAIFLTPMISMKVSKSQFLDAKKAIFYAYIAITGCYVILAFFPFPPLIVTVVYMVIYALYLSMSPLLQVMASDYIQAGQDVNFGLARGLGSVAWALGALILGFLVNISHPNLLVIAMTIFTLITFKILSQMSYKKVVVTNRKKNNSIISIIKKYPIFTIVLTGFSLSLAAATSIGTYLINIVDSLGGNTSFYGIAVFLMAVSEMPVMAITPRLLKRIKSIYLILFAGLCYIIRNFLICLAPNIPILCFGMIFQGLSFGMLTAVITYYVIFNFDADDQVEGQTMIIMMTSGFGSMIGNLFGGFLQDTFGLNAMYIFIYILTILGVILIIFGVFLGQHKNLKNEIKR